MCIFIRKRVPNHKVGFGLCELHKSRSEWTPWPGEFTLQLIIGQGLRCSCEPPGSRWLVWGTWLFCIISKALILLGPLALGSCSFSVIPHSSLACKVLETCCGGCCKSWVTYRWLTGLSHLPVGQTRWMSGNSSYLHFSRCSLPPSVPCIVLEHRRREVTENEKGWQTASAC